MINLTNENKELCFADSTQKPLTLFMYYWIEDDSIASGGYWRLFTKIDEAIILESATITEGILDANNFKLGSMVIPEIEVQWRNYGLSYKNFLCIPVQQIGDEYIAYFNGSVVEENVSEDGLTVTAKICSNVYDRLEINLKSILVGWGTATFANLISNALGFAAALIINEEDLISNFANASKEIPEFTEEELPEIVSVKDLLEKSGEFLGAHILFKGKRKVLIEEMEQDIYGSLNFEPVEFVRIPNLKAISQSLTDNNSVYKLPFYIDLKFDKSLKPNYDILYVKYSEGGYRYLFLKRGIVEHYEAKSPYEIKDNWFFEKVSGGIADTLMEEIGDYLKSLDFYYCDLQSVYAPFIEANDVLVCSPKTQYLLPDEYTALEYVDFDGTDNFIDTNVRINSQNIELSMEFELFGGSTTLFDSNVTSTINDRFMVHYDAAENALIGKIGYYGGSIKEDAFVISPVLTNQKTFLKLKFENGECKVSGVYNSSKILPWINIDTRNDLIIGSLTYSNFRFFHFELYQDGVLNLDLHPCKRNSDGCVGLYNTVSKEFLLMEGNLYPNSQGANIFIPVLSSNAKGIHSMKTDIYCKATNI